MLMFMYRCATSYFRGQERFYLLIFVTKFTMMTILVFTNMETGCNANGRKNLSIALLLPVAHKIIFYYLD